MALAEHQGKESPPRRYLKAQTTTTPPTAEREDHLRELLFEFITKKDGHVYKYWADGRMEGFEDGLLLNHGFVRLTALYGELIRAKREGFQTTVIPSDWGQQ